MSKVKCFLTTISAPKCLAGAVFTGAAGLWYLWLHISDKRSIRHCWLSIRLLSSRDPRLISDPTIEFWLMAYGWKGHYHFRFALKHHTNKYVFSLISVSVIGCYVLTTAGPCQDGCLMAQTGVSCYTLKGIEMGFKPPVTYQGLSFIIHRFSLSKTSESYRS